MWKNLKTELKKKTHTRKSTQLEFYAYNNKQTKPKQTKTKTPFVSALKHLVPNVIDVFFESLLYFSEA